MALAMAVPSIFWAVMMEDEEENNLLPLARTRAGWRARYVYNGRGEDQYFLGGVAMPAVVAAVA